MDIDTKRKLLRLERIQLTNFKCLDSLDISFPRPELPNEPDIVVMGSRNGVGKTSVMEACAISILVLLIHDDIDRPNYIKLPNIQNYFSNLIKSDQSTLSIVCSFRCGHEVLTSDIEINRKSAIRVKGNDGKIGEMVLQKQEEKIDLYLLVENIIKGGLVDPVQLGGCYYFHGYRKTPEDNPAMGMMINQEEKQKGPMNIAGYKRSAISAFKLSVFRAMMGRAGLFEVSQQGEINSQEALDKLNSIIKMYAGGTVEKLRPTSDDTLELCVTPSQGGEAFAFDGLSSGQKEIISTLFLIWYHTVNNPKIIFIDEPELHLNAEWHREFVEQLYELAPDNQYILATHSEDIFGAVEPEQRLLLKQSVSTSNVAECVL
ncbi:MAG: AAA family ATPase [Magnetococcales bacterium]|nr:AAA family ATPase [Magnetococcales bacterium]